MPKLNDLKALLLVQNEEQVCTNSDYYLFPLGTDTVFTPSPTKNSLNPSEQKSYENGETLSYMAQLVANRLGEHEAEIRTDQPLSFSTHSVDVINGPTTLGSEVGERIAQGVFLILKAIADGKQNIQIAAHSRGAVESILIAHELDRIKKELSLNDNQTIFKILSKSPCSYTRAAVKKLFAEIDESSEVRAKLFQRLSTAKLNMFLMDPVPGGSWRGIGKIIAWRDERFYPKIPCTNAELLLFRDERTRCFIPIKSTGLTPVVIPGHHGTSSGNLYSQQFQPVPEEIEHKDTALAQQLVLLKLLNFINNSTGLFDKVALPVDLEHPALDKVSNAFLSADKTQRSELLLDFYKNIHRHDKAYRHFASTAYPYLGSEASSSGARLVHADGHNYTALDSLYPSLGGQFINKEHAFLYLLKHMEFKLDRDDYQPDQLITELGNVLIRIFRGYVNTTEASSSDMSQSIVLNSRGLLESEVDRKATFGAISVFLDTISQKYLRNHLSVEIKTNLLTEIHRIFDILQSFKNVDVQDAPINKIVKECDVILRASLKDTAQTHYRTLLDQSNRLNERLRYILAPAEQFNEVFKDFMSGLDLSATEENECSILIRSVIQSLRQVNPVSVHGVKTILNEQLTLLSENDNPSAKEAISLIIKLTSGKSPNLESFFDTNVLDAAMLLIELDRIYDNIDSLINGFNHVQHLSGDTPLDIDLDVLKMHRDRIVRLAAEVLVQKQIDLHTKPALISDEFFEITKRQAIAFGGSNPEVTNLFREVDQLRRSLEKNIENIRYLKNAQEEQYSYLRELQQDQKLLIKQISENKFILEGLAHQMAATKQESTVEVKRLQREQQSLTKQLAESKSALEDLTHQLTENKQENCSEVERLKQEQQSLAKQLAGSKSAFEDLTQQLTESKQKNSAEVKRLKLEQQSLTMQLAESKSALEDLTLQLTETKQESSTEVERLKLEQQSLAMQLAESKSALEELTHQLTETKQESSTEVECLKQEQQSLAKQLAESKSALEELTHQLTETKQESSTEVECLKQEQQSLVKQLAESKSALEKLTLQLAETKQETSTEAERLKQEQQSLAKQLAESKSALEDLTLQLTESKQENSTEVECLKQEQQSLARQLAESKSALVKLTLQLAENKQENSTEVDRLKQEQLKFAQQEVDNKLEVARLAKALAQTKQEFFAAIRNMEDQQLKRESGSIEQNRELKDRFIKQEQLIQQLVSPVELKCAQLIESKLIPLTQSYLHHLLEAAESINPIVSKKQYYSILPDFVGDDSDAEQYFKIVEKYIITRDLLNQLEDKRTTPLPSERILQFNQSLHKNNDQLKQHRDPEWMQYFKSCMIGIGIVCSGIIPGLIVLMAYSSYANKSSPLFFNRTEGEEFSLTAEEHLANSPVSVN